MPKKLKDIAFKGWCRANLALLSKSTIKEMSVLEFFKNMTLKSTKSDFDTEISCFHGPRDTQSHILDIWSTYTATFNGIN